LRQTAARSCAKVKASTCICKHQQPASSRVCISTVGSGVSRLACTIYARTPRRRRSSSRSTTRLSPKSSSRRSSRRLSQSRKPHPSHVLLHPLKPLSRHNNLRFRQNLLLLLQVSRLQRAEIVATSTSTPTATAPSSGSSPSTPSYPLTPANSHDDNLAELDEAQRRPAAKSLEFAAALA